jgi:Uma2 family endonuclease
MKQTKEYRKFSSIEEYFAFEEQSEVRHEYYYENLIEMSGTTKQHNHLTFNLAFLLKQLLKPTNFDIFIENIKAYIQTENIFFYPDVMVCHPEDHQFYSTKPVLIAEVLSEGTRKFDMIDKFIQYQKMETLQYYFLVEPEKKLVIVYSKTEDNDWQSDTYTSINDIINLPKLEISIALKDIYQS